MKYFMLKKTSKKTSSSLSLSSLLLLLLSRLGANINSSKTLGEMKGVAIPHATRGSSYE